jgi:hypothetical protein
MQMRVAPQMPQTPHMAGVSPVVTYGIDTDCATPHSCVRNGAPDGVRLVSAPPDDAPDVSGRN